MSGRWVRVSNLFFGGRRSKEEHLWRSYQLHKLRVWETKQSRPREQDVGHRNRWCCAYERVGVGYFSLGSRKEKVSYKPQGAVIRITWGGNA